MSSNTSLSFGTRAVLEYDQLGDILRVHDGSGNDIDVDISGTLNVGDNPVLTTNDLGEGGEISADATTLDGYDSTDFPRKTEDASITGNWNFQNSLEVNGVTVATVNDLDDGSGVSTDATTLDGFDSTEFAILGQNESISGEWTFGSNVTFDGVVTFPGVQRNLTLGSGSGPHRLIFGTDPSTDGSDGHIVMQTNPNEIRVEDDIGTELFAIPMDGSRPSIQGYDIYTHADSIGGGTGGDAETLDGFDSTDFVKTTDTIDADTLDGFDSTNFVQTTDTIDADSVDGYDSTQLVKTTDTIDADTLDTYDSTDFVKTTDTIDADTLDSLDSSQLMRNDTNQTLTGSFTINNANNHLTINDVDAANHEWLLDQNNNLFRIFHRDTSGGSAVFDNHFTIDYSAERISYSGVGMSIGGNDVLTTASTVDASTLGGVSASTYLRGDQSEETSGVLTFTKEGTTPNGSESSGELIRFLGGQSDYHFDVTYGAGRFAHGWNWYYDGTDYRYRAGSDGAVRFGTNTTANQIVLGVAGSGTGGDVVSWSEFDFNADGSVDVPTQVNINGNRSLTTADEGTLDAGTINGSNLTVSATEPSSPQVDDLWVNTSG